uniref:Uncharacterized protein n=1 Tax=Populus trichocarpa TaxID=3694 RepID=A0A3N7FWM2_POPTR
MDKDVTGRFMPSLAYVSREKSKASNHHFEAGAQNVLLRVSAAMTNAPMILTNVPATPLRALSYYSGPKIRPKDGFVQFPQRFQRINKNDICFFDGLVGPSYLGTGSFFFSPSILWRPIEI